MNSCPSSTMSPDNTNTNDNSEWITVPSKKQKSKPNNYDDIPTSFAKIKEDRKNVAKQSYTPTVQSKITLQNKIKNIEANNILNKIDEGTYNPGTISKSLSKQIIQARQEKGLTQKDFATLCNLNIATVKDYETGVGQPKSVEINKMSNILGITLYNK
jgi:ribosome-binding protein aMBF1 (putative translation factor)